MTKFITIKVDTNDGDYVYKKSPITNEELNILSSLIDAIKNFQPYSSPAPWDPTCNIHHRHNFPLGECLREDMGEKYVNQIYPDIDEDAMELFMTFLPISECEYGMHTIVSIELTAEPIQLL